MTINNNKIDVRERLKEIAGPNQNTILMPGPRYSEEFFDGPETSSDVVEEEDRGKSGNNDFTSGHVRKGRHPSYTWNWRHWQDNFCKIDLQ